MKFFKKYMTAALALVMVASVAAPVFADAAEGDVILSLGQDLTLAQREELMKRFNGTDKDQVIEVTNREEHKYLGEFVPESKIGHKAISSAKIEYTAEGSGIEVETSERIRYITHEMYRQALETAGIKDAKITVDAPMNVSGTAALTGIMKAYETSTGKKISDKVKKAANEEMVVTSDLAQNVGADKATGLVKDIKDKIATEAPKSREEVQNIVINISNQYNLNLSPEQQEQLTDFFDDLRTTDIDWNGLAEKAKGAADQAKEYINSEEGQSLIEKIKAFFSDLLDSIFNK
ncbi:MAG: DUF1002 domain-containing protein [Peptoniphilus sp.]|nr:DUF1002 domain-containing protein [Peptoniphilus sp.]MDY3118425.1 DUF1002 domain-containing protein [Peptoniphilus sp.]